MRTALLHLFLCSSLAMAQQPGTLDPTFNPTDNGHFLGDGVQAGIVEEVLQLSDGKLIIGGDFGSYNGVETGDVVRLNSDGTIDPSFNAFSGSSGAIKALAVQPDGKVLIGGYFNTVQGVGRKSIARLNADGSLDTSFNPGSGLATGTANLAEVRSIALQADGRILIAGSFISFNGTARNNIARLNTDGSLDLSFAPGTGTNSSVEVVKITSAGMILIGGSFSTYNGSTSNNIARIYSNGTLDTSFDAGTGVGIGSGNVACIQERADGRLYIGGSFVTFNGTDCLHTARLMADGSLDNAYNSTIGPDYSFNLYNVRSIAEQTDGSVLIGGLFTTFDGTPQPHLVRVTSTGAFDPTYIIGNGPDQPVFGIVLRPDGKAVVCGSFSAYDETSAFGITVVNTNGSRDTAFNPGMGFNNAAVSALSVLADGRIMAQGGFYGYNGITRRGLARLMPDGDLDTTFDPGAGAAGGAPLCMAVQADNKVLVGGWFTSFAGVPYNRIARLNSDGSLDLSFNIGTGSNGWVHSIAVQTDGKILVGGLLSVFNGSPCNNIVRLNANGSIDASFTPGAGADGRVRNIIPLADGTIMITGDFMNYDGVPRNRIARLLANGSLDPNFDLVSGPNSISQLQVLPDGKIMISGGFSSTTGFPRSGIARLEANGTLDLAFDAQLQYNGAVLGFHVQDDGNIIVVGTPSLAFGGVLQPAIAR
ncbi:MAG: delta-60 repeat domain-containing protein, partial [Flavobacteriales bacterium]